MSHNPDLRKKLAERIKKERETKDKPAYLPDEKFDKAELEKPKSKTDKMMRRSSWRERLGISGGDIEYEDSRPMALGPLKTCKECGKEATDSRQKFCELCGMEF